MREIMETVCGDQGVLLQSRVERTPAGLDVLPRQLRAFPDIRKALLARIADHTALSGWRAREPGDFGVLWLEMWAYVGDVLAFYDERVANESYVRTAVRRPSLRRIVDLLGHVPAPGVAGSATVAAIAEGRQPVAVQLATGFRSDAFDTEKPQVFEAGTAASAHVLKNAWAIGPVQTSNTGTGAETDELIFETAAFGLARDRLVLFTLRDMADDDTDAPSPAVTIVKDVKPFAGKDGKTFVHVTLADPVTIGGRLADVHA